MANAMLDARQEDGGYRRVELITGQRRRRRWTAEEKARIVAESFAMLINIETGFALTLVKIHRKVDTTRRRIRLGSSRQSRRTSELPEGTGRP
jgi:transposase-like protein